MLSRLEDRAIRARDSADRLQQSLRGKHGESQLLRRSGDLHVRHHDRALRLHLPARLLRFRSEGFLPTYVRLFYERLTNHM